MNQLFEADKIILFLTFFVPGFISLKVYDLLVPGERRDFSKSVFDAVAYSALNFSLLLPLVALIRSEEFYFQHRAWYFVTAYLMLLVLPAVWPFAAVRILSTQRVSKHFVHPTQKAWDYVFGKREPYWVIVHLKDLRKIGGRFGSRSFASSNPAAPQIYLEEVWKLDDQGGFSEKIERSEGIVILEDGILAVEFFSYNEGEDENGRQEHRQPPE